MIDNYLFVFAGNFAIGLAYTLLFAGPLAIGLASHISKTRNISSGLLPILVAPFVVRLGIIALNGYGAYLAFTSNRPLLGVLFIFAGFLWYKYQVTMKINGAHATV